MPRLIIWLIFLVTLGVVFFINSQQEPVEIVSDTKNSPLITEIQSEEAKKTENVELLPNENAAFKKSEPATDSKEKALPDFMNHDVPFTPQAPLGDWSDRRFQDGCEEASMIMARYWLTGEELTPHLAIQEIYKLAKWQSNEYGTFVDTSGADTLNTLSKFYDIDAIILENLSAEDLKEKIAGGAIILIPSNGAILDNSYFTSPPIHHMLVVTGYDDNKKQFITNDPGTKRGFGYRYSYSTILNAAQDYPTGDHISIETRKPVFIVINPS